MPNPFDKYILDVNDIPSSYGTRNFYLRYNKRPDLTHTVDGHYIPGSFVFETRGEEGNINIRRARDSNSLKTILETTPPKNIIKVRKDPPHLSVGYMDIESPDYMGLFLFEKHEKAANTPGDELTKSEVERGLQVLGRKFPDAQFVRGLRITGGKSRWGAPPQVFSLPNFRKEGKLRRIAQRLERRRLERETRPRR